MLLIQTIKTYRLPYQSAFGPVRRFPTHMLATVPFDSPYLKHHTKTSVVYDPTQSTPVSDVHPSDANKSTSPSGGQKKQMEKHKRSPSKV